MKKKWEETIKGNFWYIPKTGMTLTYEKSDLSCSLNYLLMHYIGNIGKVKIKIRKGAILIERIK